MVQLLPTSATRAWLPGVRRYGEHGPGVLEQHQSNQTVTIARIWRAAVRVVCPAALASSVTLCDRHWPVANHAQSSQCGDPVALCRAGAGRLRKPALSVVGDAHMTHVPLCIS